MPTTYKAKSGDSLCSIGYEHGYGDCTALRSEAANAYIINRTDDPCQVKVGDIVTIPEKIEKEVSGATEQKHKFVKRGRLASIRFIHGSPDLSYADDKTLTKLNISNYVTNRAGNPDGDAGFPGASVRKFNAKAHQDEDTFKIEVLDIRAGGLLDVELEAMRPVYDKGGTITKHESFPTPRKLSVKAEKQDSTQRFRTCYLRLVTDEKDKKAADKQTLLVSDLYDGGGKDVEILDQLVRASYEIPSCPQSPKCKSIAEVPVGKDRRRMRMNVHILRNGVGGSPIVSTADAERRILLWLRRTYAQMSIAPKLVAAVREVDPPANLVSISNDLGTSAQGDGNISFRINAAGIPSQTITINPSLGDTPITTANAIASQIAAPFITAVSENPARFTDPTGLKSADIVITEAGGARVTISGEICNDSGHTIEVGRPNPLLFQEWDGTNWLVGSIEMRTVLKNYDTGDDLFDLFIISSFTSPNLLGAAMMSGHIVDPNRSAISQVKWSAFIDLRSSDGGDGFPTVIGHEAMHVVGEVMHAQSAPRQLMHPTADLNNNVTIAKRVRDGAVRYDGGTIAGQHNLVDRMRAEGASLLESW